MRHTLPSSKSSATCVSDTTHSCTHRPCRLQKLDREEESRSSMLSGSPNLLHKPPHQSGNVIVLRGEGCLPGKEGVLTMCGTNMHTDIHHSVCTEMLHIMSPLCACVISSCIQVKWSHSCTEMCITSHWCQAAMCHIAQEGIVTWCANSHVHLQSCVFAYSNCALPYQSSLRDSANSHEILLYHRRYCYIMGDTATSWEIPLHHRRFC